VVKPAFWIWAIAGVGFSALWWNRKARAQWAFLAGFILFSFLAVCPGFYFRQHYFILMLPAVALLAGVAVSAARQSLLESRHRAWSFLPVLVFLVAFADSIFLQREYLFTMDPLTACQTVYVANPFPEALQIGEYLRSHATPGARIAVLGSEPEIYFYAHRHSATGYIYTYSLMESQPYALQMQKQMIAEIEAARPEFVVFVNVPMSFGRLPNSERLIFSWASVYLHSQYEKVGTADMNEPTQYVWGDAVQSYQPRSRSFIDVFKRKQSVD
jgi:hypothetical protein